MADEPTDIVFTGLNGTQPALIPMTEDELRAAGHQLAVKNLELDEMERAHAGERTLRKEERTALRERIAALAHSIATQGR
jgi:hypothetical protein